MRFWSLGMPGHAFFVFMFGGLGKLEVNKIVTELAIVPRRLKSQQQNIVIKDKGKRMAMPFLKRPQVARSLPSQAKSQPVQADLVRWLPADLSGGQKLPAA